MRFKAVTVGFVLATTALGSAALNLGRARGAAWIGQPLELVVPVQVDPGQTDGALCAEADVFHGDSRQESSRIQVQIEPTGQLDTFNLRILSSALIDEPVVTVYLRAGCAQKSSRKYVLLADFPAENAALQNRPIAQPPTVPTVVPAETNSAIVQSGSNQSTSSAVASKTDKPTLATVPKPSAQAKLPPGLKVPAPARKIEEKSPNSAKPSITQAAPAKPVNPGKSRLRLDPVDTLSERIKSLETSSTAAVAQEEVARDSQKMQQLQADLRSLLDQAVKNEASLATLRERLEKAESDRVSVTVVYTLITLLILCIAALAYFVTKRPGFAAQDPSVKPGMPLGEEATSAAAQQDLAGASPRSQAEAVDVNLLDLDEEMFGEVMGNRSPAVPGGKSRHHNFNADALLDIRQQADFFAKLGKVDDALELLEKGIHANPVESPLLYLDLLVIANNFSRKTDFRQFRTEFVALFNAKIPEFALFRDEGRKLDAYPALLEHINSQWDSPNVLDVIEACILRDPDASESDPFDLAAFRELLHMHATALEQHRAKT